MSFIVPQSYSNIGNVLVSIVGVSDTYVRSKTIKKHIDELLKYFLHGKEYTPMEIVKGLKKELYVLENDRMLRLDNSYQPYSDAVKIAIKSLEMQFPIKTHPELYI